MGLYQRALTLTAGQPRGLYRRALELKSTAGAGHLPRSGRQENLESALFDLCSRQNLCAAALFRRDGEKKESNLILDHGLDQTSRIKLTSLGLDISEPVYSGLSGFAGHLASYFSRRIADRVKDSRIFPLSKDSALLCLADTSLNPGLNKAIEGLKNSLSFSFEMRSAPEKQSGIEENLLEHDKIVRLIAESEDKNLDITLIAVPLAPFTEKLKKSNQQLNQSSLAENLLRIFTSFLTEQDQYYLLIPQTLVLVLRRLRMPPLDLVYHQWQGTLSDLPHVEIDLKKIAESFTLPPHSDKVAQAQEWIRNLR
jgi:hypothetical protein